MINIDLLFKNIKNNLAIKCSDDSDTSDLSVKIENLLNNDINLVSVSPRFVDITWGWLEKRQISILTRFNFDENLNVSDLAGQIQSVFKKGAGGVQVFVSLADLDDFSNNISPVCSDLFFNRNLFIGLDLAKIGQFDFNCIYLNLKKVSATGLVLYFNEKEDTDFVGTVYGFINRLPDDFDMHLHFMLGNNPQKIEQVWRLFEKLRPDILPKIKFFLNS